MPNPKQENSTAHPGFIERLQRFRELWNQIENEAPEEQTRRLYSYLDLSQFLTYEQYTQICDRQYTFNLTRRQIENSESIAIRLPYRIIHNEPLLPTQIDDIRAGITEAFYAANPSLRPE